MSFDVLELPEAQLTLEYEPVADCKLYLGPTDANGYGYTTVNGTREFVHRLVFAEFNGAIPRGKRVLHSCENRGCVEKSHLHLSVPKSYVSSPRKRGRKNKTHCNRGHALVDPNLYYTKVGKRCRQCQLDYKNARNARQREEKINVKLVSDSNE